MRYQLRYIRVVSGVPGDSYDYRRQPPIIQTGAASRARLGNDQPIVADPRFQYPENVT